MIHRTAGGTADLGGRRRRGTLRRDGRATDRASDDGRYDDGARRCRAERTAGGVCISEDWTPW
jgi:hypothetical protein